MKITAFIKICSLGLLLFMLAQGCGGESENGARGSRDRNGGSRNAAIPVQVAEVEHGTISRFLLHTTTLEAEKQVDVLAKVSGQVSKLPYEEGMPVRKGALLVQLDEAELRIDLNQAKVRMQTDENTLKRAKEMLEKKLIAQENYDATRLTFESSRALYEAAALRVAYSNVRSPIDGVVTARHIELGQRVNVNQILFTVADFKPLRARIYVPEKDMGQIFEKQRASIIVDALPDVRFNGVVRMISPIVDPTNGTVKVTIDVNDDGGKLKPGMFGSVQIITETRENALLVPKRSLLIESETDQVYVFDDGKARKATLKLGLQSGENVEVLEGLQAGERIVVVGQEGLRQGLPIRIPGEQQVTSAEQGPTGSGKSGKPAAMPANGAGDNATAKVDVEMVNKLEEAILDSRFGRRTYQAKLDEDPSLANDPARKLAVLSEQVQGMLARISERAPDVATAFEEAAQKDPELNTNPLKQYEFLRERMRQFRGGGR